MPLLRRSLFAISLLYASQVAFAQWTVTNLTPDGAYTSGCRAVFGNRQAGSFGKYEGDIAVGGPVIWNGSANSWSSSPATFSSLSVDQAVGAYFSEADFAFHAAVWSGDTYSMTDLHESSIFQYSMAMGEGGGQQVGRVLIDEVVCASLWSGTTESWVNLNPAGFSSGMAYATNGSSQVGVVSASGLGFHAARWSGTAESFVDLNPPGSFESWAFAISKNKIGGYSRPNGKTDAGYWTDGPNSFVDLSPANADESSCQGITDDFQVGYIITGGGYNRAAFWSGSADSFVDLESLLPANYIDSTATGVWSDSTIVRVVGNAYNTETGEQEAFLWTQPVPEPASWLGVVGGLFFLARRRRIMKQ
jgi:hypothetical protein